MLIDSAPKTFYQPYLSEDEVRIGLETGQLIEGTLRISQKNYEEAYIDNPDGGENPDIAILGLQSRNRAFNDDVVIVQLSSRDEWIVRKPVATSMLPNLIKLKISDSNNETQKKYNFISDLEDKNQPLPAKLIQKTGKVVFIKSPNGSRISVGYLKPTSDGKQNWALFSPKDSRIPRMLVPSKQVPDGFFQRPQDFSNFLFVATIFKWDERSKMAQAKLLDCLGKAGDIKAESDAILISTRIDMREFPDEILNSLPIVKGEEWKIDENEIKKRKDFRNETVFTIDPATARDLDDALHIKRIKNCDGEGTPGWEVGVHIADVSFFLASGTELDKWAMSRATSVYLVERVIPMLPRILCEELCSLNPGVDRLTFSIVWKITDEAVIKSQWIGRSVIRSCVKLAYDHAQEMIDNPDKLLKDSDFPTLFNNRSIDEIHQSVINLNDIARILKTKRIQNGSLRLDASKLRFALKSKNGMPLAVGCEDRKEANFLVEEFMLLANMCVAKFIHSKFNDTALLRRHPPPKERIISDLIDKLEFLDCSVEFSSGKSIAHSLNEYLNNPKTFLFIYPTLVQFVLRSMQLAVYFSSGTCDNYHHYALNVPFYTHFTSPIRRYPDVIVHRLLSAALEYTPNLNHTPHELELLCTHCNNQKIRAKAVSDASAEMFFGLFVREVGTLSTIGVVINVMDAAFDVFLIRYNMVRRVYVENLKLCKKPTFYEDGLSRLILKWDYEAVKSSNERRTVHKNSSAQKAAIDHDEEDIEDFLLDEAVDDKAESDQIGTKQTLKIFSPLILVLTPVENSVKFLTTIEPTPDDDPLTNEEIENILKK